MIFVTADTHGDGQLDLTVFQIFTMDQTHRGSPLSNVIGYSIIQIRRRRNGGTKKQRKKCKIIKNGRRGATICRRIVLL